MGLFKILFALVHVAIPTFSMKYPIDLSVMNSNQKISCPPALESFAGNFEFGRIKIISLFLPINIFFRNQVAIKPN